VPILKNMSMTHSKGATSSGALGASVVDQQKQKKIITTSSLNLSNYNSPTVINVRGQKLNTTTIVTLSNLHLANPSLNPSLQSSIAKAFTSRSPTTLQAQFQQHQQRQQQQQKLLQQQQAIQIHNQKLKFAGVQPKVHNLIVRKQSPALSYAKLSSLTVTQDATLPTKIFEDDSVSPDSSIDHEENELLSPVRVDNEKVLSIIDVKPSTSGLPKIGEKIKMSESDDLLDMMESITGESKLSPAQEKAQLPLGGAATMPKTITATDELMTTLSDNSQDSQLPHQLLGGESSKTQKTGVIPIHVIAKSRESSMSPIQAPAATARVISSISSAVPPQLSPLSQPMELASTISSGSQQLRNIMSSINASSASLVVPMGGGFSTKNLLTPEVTATTISISNPVQTFKIIQQQPQQILVQTVSKIYS
jgi:[histone H3]-lysine4 N-trimethyltransferase MLL3